MKRFLAALLVVITLAAQAQWYDFIGQLQFDVNTSTPTYSKGMMFYNSDSEALSYWSDDLDDLMNLPDVSIPYRNFMSNSLGDARFNADTSKFTTGNNATFDNGGTITGTLAIDTTAADQLDGTKVFKYSNVTVNDWISFKEISLPNVITKSDMTVHYNLRYAYDGLDSDLQVRIKCTTSGVMLLDDTNGQPEVPVESNKLIGSIVVPKDCLNIKFGFQVMATNASSELFFDEFAINDDNKVANVSKSETITYTGYTSRTGSGFIKLGTLIKNEGSSLLSTDNTTHAIFTALKPIHIVANAGVARGGSTSGMNSQIRVYNSAGTLLHYTEAYTEDLRHVTLGLTYSLNVGDYVLLHTDDPLQNLPETNFSITATGYSEHVVASDSITDTDIIVEGAGNSNQSLTADVTDIPFTEILDSDNAWDGSKFTAPKSGIYNFSGSVYTAVSTDARLNFYVDGVSKGTIHELNKQTRPFSHTAYLEEGEELSLRLNVSMSLQSVSTSLHYINITKQATISEADVVGLISPKNTCWIKDIRDSGQNGGASSAGINVRWFDSTALSGDCSFLTKGALTSNTDFVSNFYYDDFTLDVGEYEISANAPAVDSGSHQIAFYDLTNSAYITDLVGMSSYSTTVVAQTNATISGSLTIAAPTQFELRHFIDNAKASDGLGIQTTNRVGNSIPFEAYTTVKIVKVK